MKKCRICGRPLPDWYPDNICPACKILLSDPDNSKKERRSRRFHKKKHR